MTVSLLIKATSSYKDILASFCAFLGSFSVGLAQGYSSPTVPQFQRLNILTTEQTTWFASLVPISGILGGPMAGVVVDWLGRKPGLIIGSVPFVIGYLCIYVTTSYISFYIGRILSGISCGFMSICVPLYIAEVSNEDRRGLLVSLYQTGIAAGNLFVYSIGITLDWQWIAVICSVFPLVMILVMLPMPETPRWLLKTGRKSEAKSSLKWLRGEENVSQVDKELAGIQQTLIHNVEQVAWKEFTQKHLYKPLAIVLCMMLFQQFSGFNVVTFYTYSLFEAAGWKGNPGLPAVLAATIKVITTASAATLIDRLGRRFMVILSGVILSISTATLGIYFFLTSNNYYATETLGWLSLSSIILYVIGFSAGWGPAAWVIASELLPLEARGKGSAIATMVHWVSMFVITKEYVDMTNTLTTYGTFWLFTAICVLGTTFLCLFLPETKGQTLEVIEINFKTDSKNYNSISSKL